MLDISLSENLETRFTSVLANNDPDAIAWLLPQETVLLGLADSGAHVSQLCDACFATDLLGNWVRDREVMPMERAIYKLTGEPAAVYGLTDRGTIAPGKAADITVFDADTVAPRPAATGPRLPRRRRAARRRRTGRPLAHARERRGRAGRRCRRRRGPRRAAGPRAAGLTAVGPVEMRRAERSDLPRSSRCSPTTTSAPGARVILIRHRCSPGSTCGPDAIDGNHDELLVVGCIGDEVVARCSSRCSTISATAARSARRSRAGQGARTGCAAAASGTSSSHGHSARAERGARLAQLSTDKTRADAHRFYESLGFHATTRA